MPCTWPARAPCTRSICRNSRLGSGTIWIARTEHEYAHRTLPGSRAHVPLADRAEAVSVQPVGCGHPAESLDLLLDRIELLGHTHQAFRALIQPEQCSRRQHANLERQLLRPRQARLDEMHVV